MSQTNLKYERIGETIFALVENGEIIKIKIIDKTNEGSVKIGQTYCGRISTIETRLSAAFIDLGKQSAILPFMAPRPKYLIEGKAINVRITRAGFLEKLAELQYMGDAKPNEACPALKSDVEDWGDWPMPIDANADQCGEICTLIASLREEKIPLLGGGYLFLEHTEALTTIDVNSGGRIAGGNNQNNFNHKLNQLAAKEICRQIKLRNIGGLIVIDFIGAPTKIEASSLLEILKLEIKDNHKCEILPISKFGLCEIARERIGNSIEAPTAHSVAIDAVNSLAQALNIAKGRKVKLRINSKSHALMDKWSFKWTDFIHEKIGGNFAIEVINCAPNCDYEII